MLDGYEAFGKSHVDTQSGRTSLETMRKISRMIDGLITVDEEAMQCIQAAHEDALLATGPATAGNAAWT